MVSSTIFWVFDMTRLAIEPRSPGPIGEHSTHSGSTHTILQTYTEKIYLYS